MHSHVASIQRLFECATPMRTELVIPDALKGGLKITRAKFNRMQGATNFIAFVK